jgi:hypothetical protein
VCTGLERIAEVAEVRGGHEVIGEARVDRVRAIHRGAREREVLADASRRPTEQPGAARVGGEADARLGHRELRPLGDDPYGRVAGKSDAAAHGDPVGEHDDRLWVLGDARVQGILRTEEAAHPVGVAAHDLLVESADVSARAQPPLARAVEHHELDVDVVLPCVQCGAEGLDHPEIEGVQGAGSVECQATETSGSAHQDIRLGRLRGIAHDRNDTARARPEPRPASAPLRAGRRPSCTPSALSARIGRTAQ